MNVIIGIVVGFVAALLLGIGWRARGGRPQTGIHHSVESFKAVGERMDKVLAESADQLKSILA